MPRIQRKKSKTGYYHIMIRGNERKSIFFDAEDKDRFIETLAYTKRKASFLLSAYCLMDNHVHLVIGEEMEDIAKVMKRIAVSYVYYFNQKYDRVGHLFQDRFKSEVVETDKYLLSLIRYVHQNPLKAGMVQKVGDYRWSSYHSYLQKKGYDCPLINQELLLKLFSDDLEKAKTMYINYMNRDSNETFLDLSERIFLKEKDAEELFMHMLEARNISLDDQIPTEAMRETITELRADTGLSLRRIAQLTGLNKNKVDRILKYNHK